MVSTWNVLNVASTICFELVSHLPITSVCMRCSPGYSQINYTPAFVVCTYGVLCASVCASVSVLQLSESGYLDCVVHACVNWSSPPQCLCISIPAALGPRLWLHTISLFSWVPSLYLDNIVASLSLR